MLGPVNSLMHPAANVPVLDRGAIMRMNELTPSIVTESNRLLAGKWKSCLVLFSAEQSLEPRRANSTRQGLKRAKRHEAFLQRPCVAADPYSYNCGPQSDCKM